MICIKCQEWKADEEGDTCKECRKRASEETRVISRETLHDRAVVAEELGLEEDQRQDDWVNELKSRIVRRYEIPDGLKCEHLPGCCYEVMFICTCGFLFDLGRIGSEEALKMYHPFMDEIKKQTETAQRLL